MEIIEQHEGCWQMKNLVDFLWKDNVLNNTYSLLFANCQHFASKVFEKFKEALDEEPDSLALVADLGL